MPHAAHFLERLDRVPRSLTDFALELYRDEARVKWIIHYAHLPKEVERVAFALDPDGEGPFIVVTREGRFVTALGAGMKPTGLTVLSRAQVDTFSARVEDARRRFELAKAVAPEGRNAGDLVGLLNTRPGELTREEFAAIGAWVPLMYLQFLTQIFEVVSTMENFRETYVSLTAKAFRRHPRTLETMSNMWRFSHGIAARYLLATMGDLAWVDDFAKLWKEEYGPTWYATDERIHSVAIRGAWAAARMGKALIPIYKRVLSMEGDPMVRFDAAMCLTAIGIRHSNHREEVRRIVGQMMDSEVEANREWAQNVIDSSNRAFDDPEGGLAEVASYGRKVLLSRASRLPEGSPYRFTKEEDVPRDLALLVSSNQTFDSLHPFAINVLPWVAKLASPEELYYPEELAAAFHEPVSPEWMAVVYERQGKGVVNKPAIAESKPGRNDPCSCGSGKKFKKCCGA